jgi:hypothetical protein
MLSQYERVRVLVSVNEALITPPDNVAEVVYENFEDMFGREPNTEELKYAHELLDRVKVSVSYDE